MELSRIAIAPSAVEAPARPAAPGKTDDFGSALADALGNVEGMQQAADAQAEKLAHGEGNLHEAAIALEKADVSMRLAVKTRNKLVEAYQEIMRMNV